MQTKRFCYNYKKYIQMKNKEGKHTFEHIQIWKDNKGEIPKGYIIHHKDGNPKNNNIDNLECLSPKEHGKRHNKTSFLPNKTRSYYIKNCPLEA
jgi:hypothetical protein